MKTQTRSSLLPVALAATILATGCATKPVLRPPTAGLRAGLGRVAVVALTDSPRLRYQMPESKADMAAEPSFFENIGHAFAPVAALERHAQQHALTAADAVSPRLVNGRVETSAEPGPYVPLATVIGGAFLLVPNPFELPYRPPVLLQPIFPEIRRAYGLVVADSADTVARARTTLDTVASRTRLDALLRDRVAGELHRAAPGIAPALTRAAADTVLELHVFEPNLSSRTGEGINPALGLSLGLRVRLLDARTGAELYYDYLDYRGPRQTFANWAAHDARLLHAELERCLAHLSSEVVAQLFTRAPESPATRDALADLGLSRRPPTPVATGGGQLWLPTRATYARR